MVRTSRLLLRSQFLMRDPRHDLPGQLHEAIGDNGRNVKNFVATSFGPGDQHFLTFRLRGGKVTQRAPQSRSSHCPDQLTSHRSMQPPTKTERLAVPQLALHAQSGDPACGTRPQ